MYYCALFLGVLQHTPYCRSIVDLEEAHNGLGSETTYSPDFLSLVRFCVFWSTVSVNFLLRKYYN